MQTNKNLKDNEIDFVNEKHQNVNIRRSLPVESTRKKEDNIELERSKSLYSRSKSTEFNVKFTREKSNIAVIEEEEDANETSENLNKQNDLQQTSFNRQIRQGSKTSITERKISQQTRPGSNRSNSTTPKISVLTIDGQLNSGLETNNSSVRGSVRSLPVIREQYCCCKRWTKLERKLGKAVALLAIIIIALIVTVGILAKRRDPDSKNNRFLWAF